MSAFDDTSRDTIRLHHEFIHHVRGIRQRALCICSAHGATIDLEPELCYCLPWLAPALLLCRLSSFGLANSGCLLEVLVEGPGRFHACIAPSTIALNCV